MRLLAGRRAPLIVAASMGAIAALALVTASVAAHPLGNFTINHYAGLRVSPTAVALDVVIDFAEIPAFQQRDRIDTDGNGSIEPAELETERIAACPRLASDLRLTVDGGGVPLATTGAGVSMPAGTGGLPTLRLVCQFAGAIAETGSLAGPVAVRFEDGSFPERIGWREVVVLGDGTSISGADLSSVDRSARLTTYPDDLLQAPLDVRVVEFTVAPGGPSLAPFRAPDASPLALGSAATSGPTASPGPESAATPAAGAVPGGIQEEIAGLLEVRDLTPLAILASMLVAFGLGALHAVSPGHGKTVMAAYLVGSRGSVRHAVGLGLTVTIAHTVGVLALALVTLFASNIIAPERLYPVLGVASGGLVIAIGVWLLYARLRAIGLERAGRRAHADDHGHAHEHEHEHEHAHGDAGLEHRHGPFRHSHVPARGATLTWRSLFTLGLAGGLVPSASALLLLLGSISAGRPAYGIVLVFAFGLGMAVVLGGLGIVLVRASRLLEHARPGRSWHRVWAWMPTATAFVVVVAGVYITSQAVQTVF